MKPESCRWTAALISHATSASTWATRAAAGKATRSSSKRRTSEGRSAYRNANPETLRLVERFTRIAPDKIRWAVTVEDPTTWTRPWTFAVPLTITDSEPVMPYECHEGNYAMTNILSGARAEETAGAQPTIPGEAER